jgi:riboflavin kinase / FMN adenylyltransferase
MATTQGIFPDLNPSMQHFRSLEPVQLNKTWVTIGMYDGVHLGHQAIIQQITSRAHQNEARAVVITFDPHPARIISGRSDPLYLTSPEQRAYYMGELGVDVVITYPFDKQTANMPGANFLAILHKHLDIAALWVGYDFAMGHQRDTGIVELQTLSEKMGFALHLIQPVELGGEVVSSSKIRSLLRSGEVDIANKYLGRPYQIDGNVIPGDGRGRTIGVPTANLAVWEEQVIPERGVYACRACVDGVFYAAATNIGIRPTFDGKTMRTHIEAHLLDIQMDLYGKTIQLEFLKRLRGEQKFTSIEALVNQIQQDILQTRRVLQP